MTCSSKWWSALSALLLAVAAGGCGGKGNAGSTYVDPHPLPPDTLVFADIEPGSYGGRFVYGRPAGPRSFNAIMANETSTTDVTDRLFAGLAEFDNEKQGIYPQLAKSWDVSVDGLTWTWRLRRGAAFSDGHPLTSEDVLFSFEVCYDDSLHPSIQDLLKIDGKPFEVSAPDSYTVITKISKTYAMLVGAIGSVKIMPKHVLENAYRRGGFAAAYSLSTSPDSLVTSGAWRLKEYVANEKTVLARNPYWLGVDSRGKRLPYLDELVFLIVPDQDAADLKFRAGEVDGLDDVKPENYRWYQDNQQSQNFTLYDVGPVLNTTFMWFNLNKVHEAKTGKKLGAPLVGDTKYAWFGDKRFRTAVSKALDRDAMIQSVFFGDAVKCWSIMTPGNKIWSSPETKHWDYDPEGAKQLLAEIGYRDKNGDGFLEDAKGKTISFTLMTNSSNKLRVAMTNFIRDDLAKVGIKCTPAPVEFNTMVTHLREDLQYEAALLGLQSAVPPDPAMGANVYRSTGLTHYWHIKQPRPDTPAEAEMDRLINANATTYDLAERKRIYRQIEDIIADQSFVIFLPVIKLKIPVRNRFGNLHPSVVPHRLLWNIDQVYVKPHA